MPGYNVRPNEINGLLGCIQLNKLDNFINNRRKNADQFKNIFKHNEKLITQEEIGSTRWFGFSLIANGKDYNSGALLRRKLEDLGFECRPIVTGNFTKTRL